MCRLQTTGCQLPLSDARSCLRRLLANRQYVCQEVTSELASCERRAIGVLLSVFSLHLLHSFTPHVVFCLLEDECALCVFGSSPKV